MPYDISIIVVCQQSNIVPSNSYGGEPSWLSILVVKSRCPTDIKPIRLEAQPSLGRARALNRVVLMHSH